jgi:hypothetical protein
MRDEQARIMSLECPTHCQRVVIAALDRPHGGSVPERPELDDLRAATCANGAHLSRTDSALCVVPGLGAGRLRLPPVFTAALTLPMVGSSQPSMARWSAHNSTARTVPGPRAGSGLTSPLSAGWAILAAAPHRVHAPGQRLSRGAVAPSGAPAAPRRDSAPGRRSAPAGAAPDGYPQRSGGARAARASSAGARQWPAGSGRWEWIGAPARRTTCKCGNSHRQKHSSRTTGYSPGGKGSRDRCGWGLPRWQAGQRQSGAWKGVCSQQP